MDEYQKEQLDAILMVKEYLAGIPTPERMKLSNALTDYLLFRDKVNTFLAKHFTQICSQQCYQSKRSACCSKEGIVTFFADVVVNMMTSKTKEIEDLCTILQQPNSGFKCIYLGKHGCMWRVKPIVCEMFLCDQAIKAVFDGKPRLRQEWKSLEQERKLFTWPDRPVLFDKLERIFIDAGYHSSLMYMHNSPGLLRVKKLAQKQMYHRDHGAHGGK
ncbi:MAG: hypothetical protein SWH54_13195 [Thermodesulfobacteriota bacterium]|nr:hypothetical protein [Thermodesulfobacteriota bacterium]